MPSKALEVNLECSRVDVTISDEYLIVKEVMSKYPGIMEGVNTFLEEVCHPYRNWRFIVKEARSYALDYFHLLKVHPKGPEAAKLYAGILLQAVERAQDSGVKRDATDDLLIYLQKIIRDSGDDFSRFLPSLVFVFDHLRCYDDDTFFLYVRSYYQFNRIAQAFLEKASSETDCSSINGLFAKYLTHCYSYWLNEEDPQAWFNREAGIESAESGLVREIFQPISHNHLESLLGKLESITRGKEAGSKELLGALIPFPGYNHLVDTYRETPHKLFRAGGSTRQSNTWKLVFLFRIMDTEGVSSIHEEALREINRTLKWLIANQETQHVERMLEKTFDILKVSSKKFPGTALTSVLSAGTAVYKIDDSDMVDFFMDRVVTLGFQTPELTGVGDDWQIQANTAHIHNIRTWLEIIEQNPKWSKKLLSALIIHLSLGGVFIKDTDLFPRDITGFLNSEIGPVYNLAKQLARLFPSYFNDIGAEGELRDISTRLDELCLRKDILVHFLRKQSHVESSNRIIGFIEAMLHFWRTKEKAGLASFVPPNIFNQIETEGPYVDGVHRVVAHLFEDFRLLKITDLMEIWSAELKDSFDSVQGVTKKDLERVQLTLHLHKIFYQKYELGTVELENYVKQLQTSVFPELDRLKRALNVRDTRQKLSKLLSFLEGLKDVILSPEEFEIREDIYHKRHFAVDIPSMYGMYHERKFDTLGLSFRLEALVNQLFEELVDRIDLNLITRATFSRIYNYLGLFYRALKLDGISSAEVEGQLGLLAQSLKIRGFSFTQFLDIFRGLSQAVRNIVNDYFNNTHQQNLIRILEQLPVENLMPKYRPLGPIGHDKLVHRVSEIFLRDRISSSLGLQQLDLFLSRIMNTLFKQADRLPKKGLRLLLDYDPQRAVTPMSPVNTNISDVIYLGSKGMNLVRLCGYGFPVPPGFIVTTEVFRCREIIDSYSPTNRNLKEQIAREIAALEGVSGKRFGDPKNPLLLSVRSGSAISQPGMMDTFLNVGINEDVAHGVAKLTKNIWFAWDCYRRFLQSYGMAFGLDRDDFDAIIAEFKDRLGVPYKSDFTGPQMKDIALRYKDFLFDNKIDIESSPVEQLYVTVGKVMDSWDSEKAETYRSVMRISDDWGTAVTVQQMVFGNISRQSGSGVVFSHNPRWSGDMVTLWGDFTLGNQGEDVVSGLVKTLPISNKQAKAENRMGMTLETHFPELYRKIRNVAKQLIYTERWGPQEMEFTFESPLTEDLFFLQTRDMAIRERRKVLSFVAAPESRDNLVGHGIGVSGGAMAGRVVYSLDEIQYWRKEEPETSLILVRGDTVPDDIKEISEADGLLTGRGGATSHAAIVAHRLEKTCVVGCANLVCRERDGTCSIESFLMTTGDWISIDGQEGSIYQGRLDIKEAEGRQYG